MRPGPSRNADPAGLAVTVARVRAGVPAVGEAGAASNPPGDPPWAPGFFLGNYTQPDRKSTRLNSSHSQISYAAFCLEKNAEFPAYAARRLGWLEVPLLCGHDMDVQLPHPRGVPTCIRIILRYRPAKPQSAMRFAFLR